MDLRTLQFFLTVAEEGSISRAAEQLHISQPTVSREMMELEKELNKTLLVRTSKNVSLTPDGLLFRETARDMLALYQKAVAQKAESADLVGEIYLGAGETESFSYIADRIKEFRKSHPKVVFHIISENADEIRADIDKGVLDLGFVMRSGNLERYHQLEIDRWESWGAIVPLEHPLAQNKSITGQALLQYPLILPENQAFQKQLIGWLDGEPEIAVTYNLIRNALPFVKNGTGLVLCLNDPALTESGLCFVPLRPAHVVSPVLIWKKHVVQSPAVQAFLKTFGYSKSE